MNTQPFKAVVDSQHLPLVRIKNKLMTVNYDFHLQRLLHLHHNNAYRHSGLKSSRVILHTPTLTLSLIFVFFTTAFFSSYEMLTKQKRLFAFRLTKGNTQQNCRQNSVSDRGLNKHTC